MVGSDGMGMTLMQRVPNALSAVRIPLSLSLLTLDPFSPLFALVYLAVGVTDALDGFIARKYEAVTRLGAQLDSAGDLAFFAAALCVFIRKLNIPLILVLWALALVAVRTAGLAAAYFKYREWAALHTYGFKATAFAFYLFPLLYGLLGAAGAGTLLCLLATAAVSEELIINTHAPALDVNVRTLLDYKNTTKHP